MPIVAQEAGGATDCVTCPRFTRRVIGGAGRNRTECQCILG